MDLTTKHQKLSVVIPVCDSARNAADVFQQYKAKCETLASEVEYIYVSSTNDADTLKALRTLKEKEASLHLIILSRSYGEGTALQAGFDLASGDLILTLPASYTQVEVNELDKLFEKIDEFPVVLAKRWPRSESGFNRAQSRVFNWLLKYLSDQTYSDIGCSVKLMRAEVTKELYLYGEQHRFLPLLAYQAGFLYTEVDISSSVKDSPRIYAPKVYVRRTLDLITIVFLTKFNKKPLRFFGLIGSAAIIFSVLGMLYMAYQRLALDMSMADRPLLVMFCLFLVLGVQLMAIGLVGETVTFIHARDNKEYRIKEIIED